MEDLKYPIGKHINKNEASNQEIIEAINVLKYFPTLLENTIENMDEQQLKMPYRQDGWNTIQVIHHCADSHMNCLIRLKLALTEDNPTIKPYNEAEWANCLDYNLPLNNSTTLLHCIHKKLVSIFENLNEMEWKRTYYHPENNFTYTLQGLILLYAWHCNHHLAHIQIVKNKIGSKL